MIPASRQFSAASAVTPQRETFVPFRRRDVIAMCLRDPRLPVGDRPQFEAIATLVLSLIHHEFHAHLEAMKDAYAPVNPDLDTRALRTLSPEDVEASVSRLLPQLERVVAAANFQPVTRSDLEQALEEESLFQVRLAVDFDDFQDLLFFRRGESQREETLVSLFGLHRRRIVFTHYDRVLVYVRFRDAAYFEQQGRRNLPFEPGSLVIKLFQNVPRADLEMLFPNSEVRMRTIDKLFIGVPAAASGVAVLTTKLGSTLVLLTGLLAFWLGLRSETVTLDQSALVALAMGLGALGGYLWKQFNSFANRKMRFLKQLADNLYFRNLDNNAGVLHRLVDAAEEEECKEVLLACFFLLTAPAPCTAAELDAAIERWFRAQWDTTLDFDVSDALSKLLRLDLVTPQGDAFGAVPLDEASRRLNRRWDDLFEPASAT